MTAPTPTIASAVQEIDRLNEALHDMREDREMFARRAERAERRADRAERALNRFQEQAVRIQELTAELAMYRAAVSR